MRYWSLIIVFCIIGRAAADQAANGSNGINSRVTGLTGAGGCCVIGQVEPFRPGKPNHDSASNVASNTNPIGVFFQTGGGLDSADSHINFHATGVANIMVGQNTSLTGNTAVDYPTYEGVAPGAFLYSDAVGNADQVTLVEGLNRIAKISGGAAVAINMSFIVPVSFPEGPNGSSYFSLFLDWSARQHDVLYVAAWGNDDPQQNVDRAGRII